MTSDKKLSTSVGVVFSAKYTHPSHTATLVSNMSLEKACNHKVLNIILATYSVGKAIVEYQSFCIRREPIDFAYIT